MKYASHCNITLQHQRWLKIDRHDWRLIDIQTSQCALRFWLWKKRLSDYGLFWKIPLPMKFAVCRAIKENDFKFLSLLLSLCLLRTQQPSPNPIKRNCAVETRSLLTSKAWYAKVVWTVSCKMSSPCKNKKDLKTAKERAEWKCSAEVWSVR